jgi:hypothetical protein
MDPKEIARLAEQLLGGELPLDQFLRHMSPPVTADLDEAQIDVDRRRRCGYPEVIFGHGKSVVTLEKIFHTLLAEGTDVLATRISPEQASGLTAAFPQARYNQVGKVFRIPLSSSDQPGAIGGHVAIVTAGTSDLPVAEEARETLLWMGASVTMIFDVGVAGPHRLREHLDELERADAVVVIAGMEGALPSVVGGYVSCPVIGVPTSIGYGANLGGFTALLSMLNSCAANVAVVNIDAGFKGAYLAGMIAQRAHRERQGESTGRENSDRTGARHAAD